MGWSIHCTLRVVSDTWLSLFSRLLCEPFEQSDLTQLACDQHCVHYLHLVVGVLTTGHQREDVFASYEPYLDTDTVENKSVLEKEVDV